MLESKGPFAVRPSYDAGGTWFVTNTECDRLALFRNKGDAEFFVAAANAGVGPASPDSETEWLLTIERHARELIRQFEADAPAGGEVDPPYDALKQALAPTPAPQPVAPSPEQNGGAK